eukprot:Phypoly_transcript_14270.p1 GENE.Phypoly_transcript_14270~~Phypoly_transcript_14270.p1  ORF type:complete len:325 (+),score=49.86 Phypoly_transcript_14270:26-976(+)
MAFHINTPLLDSPVLSKITGTPVFLKLDSLQPSGSFKIRGLGRACAKARENGATSLVCASGGNAGVAVAYSGRKMNVPTTIVLPETTPPLMRNKIAEEGAKVIIHGQSFNEAEKLAKEIAQKEGGAYIPPFDHPDVWEGNSTMVDELVQSASVFPGGKPGAVVTVCGGGGLFCGLALGMQRAGWNDVPIVVVETEGAHSFHQAIKEDKLVFLDSITSIAKTLGALCVCEEAYNWTKKRLVESVLVSDKMAVDAICRFANDHRVLVEPSCGAALAIAYQNHPVFTKLQPNSILIVVCGGNIVSLDLIQSWQKMFENQ